MTKAKVDHRDFVVAYASSQTMQDVMKTTGMSRSAIYTRRVALEKKGVKFPQLTSERVLTELDIAQLNSLIKKHDIRKK